MEILDTLLPERVHRNNPRVVKKPVSKFRSKKPKHRGTGLRVVSAAMRQHNSLLSLWGNKYMVLILNLGYSNSFGDRAAINFI